ncbi:hypothetical protein HZC35_07945 [Candidatus Saganbacteria bacterium]|nr:hypothetical protein [Candidatus Saganbacteria bacterium]
MREFDLSRVFVNTGGYGLQLTPPETSQTADTQQGIPANVQSQAPYTPTISPLSSDLNYHEEYSIVSDYAAAEAELLANIPPDQINDYFAGEEVPEDQREKLEEYDQKRLALVEYEQALFRRAFLSDPDPAAENRWRTFEELVNESGIGESIAAILISLADPHMDSFDRVLLYDLAFSDEISDEMAFQLEDRFVHSWREGNLSYNGFGKPLSPEKAFINGISIIYGDRFTSFAQAVLGDILSETLTLFSDEAAQRYLQMSDDDFGKELLLSEREYQRAPLGSELRIAAYRRFADLNTISYVRGLDEGFSEEIAQIEFPGLSSAELDMLETATLSQQEFISSIEYFSEEYYQTGLCDERRPQIMGILSYLDKMASAYDIDRQQMDEYLAQARQKAENPLTLDSIDSLSDLDPDRDISVPPDGLPAEVKDILRQTGYWDYVSQIREIRLLSGEVNLLESRMFNDNLFDGQANPYLGYVEIEWKGKSAWEIAEALVHEAAHVAWRHQAQNDHERESLPNERHSCLMEAGFLQSYLNNTNLSEEERSNIELFYVDRVACVTSADRAMGASPDNYDDHVLPSPEYLAFLGLDDISQFDLNIAAYFQVQAYVDDEIALHNIIWESVNCPEAELNMVQDILGRVMQGDSFLELNYAYDQGAITNIEMSLVSDSEPGRNLNENEVQALLHFFSSIDALARIASRSQYSDEAGFNYLISAGDLLPEIYSYTLRAHPNSLLNR